MQTGVSVAGADTSARADRIDDNEVTVPRCGPASLAAVVCPSEAFGRVSHRILPPESAIMRAEKSVPRRNGCDTTARHYRSCLSLISGGAVGRLSVATEGDGG